MQIISISKGSISKRTNGHYRAQFIITYEDGTKERQSITAEKKHDLQAKMAQFKKNIFSQHNEKDGSYKNSFVYYLLNDWMREKRVVEKLENHTLLTHEQRIRHDLRPFFGNMKPQDITAKHIIELYEKMVKRGLQPETIHRVHAIMNNAFKKLMRDDRVSKNPCQFIKLPKIVVEEKKPLTQDGAVGPVGPKGADGVDGANGEMGPIGPPGKDGQNGKSAYEIALDYGFIGTEADWLASLSYGVSGKPGDSAYQIATKNGFSGTVQEWLQSLVGPQGPKGSVG